MRNGTIRIKHYPQSFNELICDTEVQEVQKPRSSVKHRNKIVCINAPTSGEGTGTVLKVQKAAVVNF